MKFNIDRYSKYSPLILRASISFVFLWFGFSQITNPSQWSGMVPSYASIVPLSATTLVLIHGVFEFVFGLLLGLGMFTRISALLLGLNLLHTVYILGYGPTAVRDFGIALATLSIALRGRDDNCLDRYIFRKR